MRRVAARGFTVVEVLLTSGLMSLLALLLAASWTALGRPLVEATARANVAQEAQLAIAALARDFGGSAAGSDARLGTPAAGALVGRMQAAGSVLRLCYDSPLVPNGLADWDTPDQVVSYEVQDNQLVRWDESQGTTFVVARYVESMELAEEGAGVRIVLTLSHRGFTRAYTLVGVDP